MAKNKNIIEVKNLTKIYKKEKTPAIENVSLNVKKGKFYALLGPNGAGKTTTISILTTTLTKFSGEVKIAGLDVEKNAQKVRQKIGVIFQKPSLDPNLTAEENIRFHANLYGLYFFRPTYRAMPESYRKRVGELASLLGIEDSLFKQIKTFSGGMKRKLEIVRGLMHEPEILFLDEPTTGLDPVSRKALWNYLNFVRLEKKITVFLTTHYLEEAEDADVVTIINNGKVVFTESPAKLKEKIIDNYLTIDSRQNKKLAKELSKKTINYQGDGPFRIKLNGIKPGTLIQSLKTPISQVDVRQPSLEEAYLNLINE